MPNSAGADFGIMTRIADTAIDPNPPPDSLYGAYVGREVPSEGGGGTMVRQLRVDAIPVRYDHGAWLRRFSGSWPKGTAAHTSYHSRISIGPASFDLSQAARAGFEQAK
jgi:hypothetical protein